MPRSRDNRDPLPGARLRDAILSLQPTSYHPLDDGNGPLRDIAGGNWNATVTGSPTFGVGAPEPIGRGVTWSGSGQYATTATGITLPSASMSALGFFRTTDATAANRFVLGRGAASQHSWGLGMGSTHLGRFFVSQSNGSAHALQTAAGAVNDGLWHLVAGTFDGTTLRVYRDLVTASSTSLTGTWHTASTAAVQVAAYNTTTLWIGDAAHVAYFADRVLSAADLRHIHSTAFGG